MRNDTRFSRFRFLLLLAERLPLRLVFSLPFLLQFFLAVMFTGLLLFQSGQDSVQAVLKELRQEILERVEEQVSRHMREPLRLNALNADAWRAELLSITNPVVRDRYFASHIRAFPDAAMTFIGLADGSFYGARRKSNGEIQVVHNNQATGGASWYFRVSDVGDALERQEVYPDFDPRKRPWFEAAKLAGRPVFSEVYRHFVFQEPTVTAVQPIYDASGKLIGVFGVDYLLSWLGTVLSDLPLGASGQVFVTDSEGLLVASSVGKSPFEERNGRMERIRAADSNNEVLRMAVHTVAATVPAVSQAGAYEFKLADQSYFVDVRNYQQNGINWNIYVVLAADDFLSDLRKVANHTAGMISLLMVVIFLLAIWTAGWVTKPIQRLNTAARELAEGRLKLLPDTERRDELGQLSRSFNTMACQVTDLVTNLETRVAERTHDLTIKTEQEERLRKTFYAELSKAGKVQRTMIPADICDERLKLQILYEPCLLVSGDTCGYRWLKEDVLFGYLIDVNGHGAATALQTAAMNVIMQETLQSFSTLSACIADLNKRVAGYFGDDIIIAAFCFEVDFRQHELRYVAAGITEFFADTAKVKGRMKTPGLFLGVSNAANFDVQAIPLLAGDRFCFYSDGIADELDRGMQLTSNMSFIELVNSVGMVAAEGVSRDDVTAICIELSDKWSV